MDKYCRICWNTSKWQQPSSKPLAVEMGNSYVAEHGFGHEEWIFNFEWVLAGYDSADLHSYKYGFLQPINKYRDAYIGQTFSVLLYTVNPNRKAMIVACIRNLYVPTLDELTWVLNQTMANGWLASMKKQLVDLGISVDPLVQPEASSITNVRFLHEDVVFYEPMIIVQDSHKIKRINRYVPLNWNDGFLPSPSSPVGAEPPMVNETDISPERSEIERMRASQMGTIYDPRHVRLQNKLFRVLCAQYGTKSILYEKGYVDLTLIEPSRTTFIEIKTDLTVKSCIRSAFGQLVEYSHYPNLKKADMLMIVGDAIPTPEDALYLRYIRDNYKVPVYYSRWSTQEEKLENRI
jgi:hypothetical protein